MKCLKSVSIFWDYNNLNENIHYYTYGGTKIKFKDGYYTFDILRSEWAKFWTIELKPIKFSRKCTIKSNKILNLKTFGPIIGFPENKISVNTLTENDNVVNVNNNLKYVNISCNMIDE